MKLPCNTNNTGYRLECETCLNRGKTVVYEGETSRSARTRGLEHLRDLNNKKSGSALHKHKEIEHKGETMSIKMSITNKFKDPLTRQANEAVRINNRNRNELLNSKTEFNHPPIPRITVERKPFLKKKSQTSKDELNSNANPALKCPSGDVSLSGIEEFINTRCCPQPNQKQLSSEQDNYIESTMLNL